LLVSIFVELLSLWIFNLEERLVFEFDFVLFSLFSFLAFFDDFFECFSVSLKTELVTVVSLETAILVSLDMAVSLEAVVSFVTAVSFVKAVQSSSSSICVRSVTELSRAILFCTSFSSSSQQGSAVAAAAAAAASSQSGMMTTPSASLLYRNFLLLFFFLDSFPDGDTRGDTRVGDSKPESDRISLVLLLLFLWLPSRWSLRECRLPLRLGLLFFRFSFDLDDFFFCMLVTGHGPLESSVAKVEVIEDCLIGSMGRGDNIRRCADSMYCLAVSSGSVESGFVPNTPSQW